MCVQKRGIAGGWTLAKPWAEITLLDIHEALGGASIFAIGLSTDHLQCLVEQAVNAALSDAFDAAQALLLERLWGVTLEQFARDFAGRFQALSGPVVADKPAPTGLQSSPSLQS